jgi:hypothetical protein
MSTTRSLRRIASANPNRRSAAASPSGRAPLQSQTQLRAAERKKDRSSLCTFTFADARRCRTPLCSASLSYCFFHARREDYGCGRPWSCGTSTFAVQLPVRPNSSVD